MTTRDYRNAQRVMRAARVDMLILIYTAEYLHDHRTNGFAELRDRFGGATLEQVKNTSRNAAHYATAQLGTRVILGTL